jgi:hypothetical protein
LKTLEDRIQRVEDIHEIHNLMGRYEYLHTAGLHEETAELFGKKTPGVKAEINDWGVYEGQNGIQKMFVKVHKRYENTKEDRRGVMNMHALTTPVIEIAGDGKTAKAVWISPGHETSRKDGKLVATWRWVKYAVDFVKEDGQWRFWHFHVFGVFRTPYDKSWLEPTGFNSNPQMPPELRPDRPTTYHWVYSPEAVTENIPAPPEPYETWDESTSYVK